MQGGREFSYRSNPMVRCSTHATNQSSIGEDAGNNRNEALQVIAGPSYDKSIVEMSDNNAESILKSNSSHGQDDLNLLLEQIGFFERFGGLNVGRCKVCRWLAPCTYALVTIPYWVGYGITLKAAVTTAVALLIVLLIWTEVACVSSTVGMRFLLHYLSLPHTLRCGDVEGCSLNKRRVSMKDKVELDFARQLAMPKGQKHGAPSNQNLSPTATSKNESYIVRELHKIAQKHRRLFFYSCLGNFMLLTIWCPQAAMRYENGSWETMLCYLAIPLGSISYLPVFAQLTMIFAMLEMTSTLVSEDVDYLRDAVLDALLEGGSDADSSAPSPSSCLGKIRDIDDALTAIRQRMLLLHKSWSRVLSFFLGAWLILETIYLLVAFVAPGAVSWWGRIVLIALATVPASSLVQCLVLMAAPGDHWAQHMAFDLSTAKVTYEAQRLFQDGQAFRQILKEERLGFMVGGFTVSTRTVIGASATAFLGLLFCIIEVAAESSSHDSRI